MSDVDAGIYYTLLHLLQSNPPISEIHANYQQKSISPHKTILQVKV